MEHSTKQKRKAALTQQAQRQEALCSYEEVLEILYILLDEFSYLGLHLPTADSIRYTKNPIKWFNSIPIHRYQVTVKESFQTDVQIVKQLLNRRITQTLEYQLLYILDIKKLGNTLIIAVVMNNPATDALIADYEHRKKSAANVSADMRDEDF